MLTFGQSRPKCDGRGTRAQSRHSSKPAHQAVPGIVKAPDRELATGKRSLLISVELPKLASHLLEGAGVPLEGKALAKRDWADE
jgi:hypothetical protein